MMIMLLRCLIAWLCYCRFLLSLSLGFTREKRKGDDDMMIKKILRSIHEKRATSGMMTTWLGMRHWLKLAV